VPLSLGGNDSAANIVELTRREHYLVHWLLVKIHTTGNARRSMEAALLAITARLLGSKRALARLAYFQRTAMANMQRAQFRAHDIRCIVSWLAHDTDEEIMLLDGSVLQSWSKYYPNEPLGEWSRDRVRVWAYKGW
jgi:hypothetical protein